jgi:hypothetical protein
VAGRWRVFEDTTPGYWGIELEDAGNDDDAILYPQKIHRDTVARIVDAHNAALATTDGRNRNTDIGVSPTPSAPSQHVLPIELDGPKIRIAFGLEAQGHIPAVEAALAEGADWQEIGRRIGWDGNTAKGYYERHVARLATTEGKDNG